jgi:MarR family transcriptional regulator, organic hydroperoxide resistance regulator
MAVPFDRNSSDKSPDFVGNRKACLLPVSVCLQPTCCVAVHIAAWEIDRQLQDMAAQAMSKDILLDEQLCFAIYSATHAFNRFYKPRLDRLGLTYPQYLVMMVLWEEEPQTVGSIGERLLLDSSTLTPLLKRLETAGYVSRTRSSRDERVVEVTLTPVGRSLREDACPIPEAAKSATGTSMTELNELRHQLVTIRDALNTADPA